MSIVCIGGLMVISKTANCALLVLSLLAMELSASAGSPVSNTPFANEPYIPDIATFLMIGSSDAPGYSPITGEFYFTDVKMAGSNQLYRITKDGWPYRLTFFDDGIDGYFLSHDGLQAIITASTGGSEQSQLFWLDATSGRIKQLTDNPKVQFGSIVWNNAGTGFYYRCNVENPRDFRIYFHDLATGKQTKIFDMEGANYIADLSHDNKFMVIYHFTSNANDDLYLLNLETGRHELLTPHEGDVFYDYPTLMKDNKTLYLTCNDNPEGLHKRARMNVATKKIEYLDPESNEIIEGLGFSHNRDYMIWLVNEQGYATLHARDMKNNRTIPAPPVKGYVADARILDDGRILFGYSSPSRTQDLYLWDWRRPELKRLTTASYAGIDPDLFIDPELITYKSFDGLDIPAFLYLPPDYKGQPVPFIIHLHGGPESQFRPGFVRHFQYLMLNGYGILAPNIRGSSGYGKEYMDLDNYKNRLNSIKDIKAGVDYLIEKGYTRQGMIGVKGASYGGYATLACITEYPDLFSAAVNEVGIANFVTFLQNTAEYRRHLREAEYGPLSDSAFLASISPLHKADQIKTPLLVIHGENDPRVPYSEALQIFNAVRDNGGLVDTLIFSDEGHGSGKTSNTVTTYRKIVVFFDKFLKRQ